MGQKKKWRSPRRRCSADERNGRGKGLRARRLLFEGLETRTLLADGGPKVIFLSPSGPVGRPIDQVDLLFDEAIAGNTFSASDISISGPAGMASPITIAPVGLRSEHSFLAYIDGRDQLIVQANTVQWHHLECELPGKWNGADEPTYVDGQTWWPDWPGGSDSSIYTELDPPLASSEMNVSLEIISGRGSVVVAEQPSAANGYATVLEFDDPQGGASWYEVRTLIEAEAPDGNASEYRVSFPYQDTPGEYSIEVGPDVWNLAGQEMDQDGDGAPGEPEDAFTDQFQLAWTGTPSLSVVQVAPAGDAEHPFDRIEVVFSEPLQSGTFDVSDVVIVDGTGTPIAPTAIDPLGLRSYALDFTGLTGRANYTLSIGPDIRAGGGALMNQDGDGTAGEPEDAYRGALVAQDLSIAEGDTSFDGLGLLVHGASVIVSGSHSFGHVGFCAGAEVTYAGSSLEVASAMLEGGSTFHAAGGSTFTIDGLLALLDDSAMIAHGADTVEKVGGQWIGRGVTLHAESVLIGAAARISADAQGYAGGNSTNRRATGSGPGGGGATVNGGSGGSYGGLGGLGSGSAAAGAAYGQAAAPTELGSGGGQNSDFSPPGHGGAGGGAIRLIVLDTLTLEGEISADGESGAGSKQGGGAGGSIYITTQTLAGRGILSASAGAGIGGGAGGSGGRTAVYHENGDRFFGFTTAEVHAGTGYDDIRPAEPGTAGFFHTGIPGNHLGVHQTYTVEPDEQVELGMLSVLNGGTLTLGGGSQLRIAGALNVFADSQIRAMGKNTLSPVAAEWVGQGVSVEAGEILVAAGGSITADGQGYAGGETGEGRPAGSGPGGAEATVYGGSGGSHGGLGGVANGGAAVLPSYNSLTAPTDLGSGGGDNSDNNPGGFGGAGGGALRLLAYNTLRSTARYQPTAPTARVASRGAAPADRSIWPEPT